MMYKASHQRHRRGQELTVIKIHGFKTIGGARWFVRITCDFVISGQSMRIRNAQYN